jgi:hypothetical protein
MTTRKEAPVTEPGVHPLATMILEAASGRFPVPDGGWRRMAPWRPGIEAVVAFTAHAVLCVDDDVGDDLLAALGIDGYGGAHRPKVLTTLAGPDGWVSSLDLIMVRRPAPAARRVAGGSRPAPLVERPDLGGESRVAYAARLRDDLTVLGYPDRSRSAVAILGRGIAGLPELSYELEAGRRGHGEGADLVRAALLAAGRAAPLVACVAPGNVASLRLLLTCGFVPVGSVQMVRRTQGHVPRVPPQLVTSPPPRPTLRSGRAGGRTPAGRTARRSG